MDPRLREILLRLSEGQLPETVPDDLDGADVVRLLASQVDHLQRCAVAIANGDLSLPIRGRGPLASSLKALQAVLRHVTWQTQQVAAGDFSQRVEFLGDFSEAFNMMVEQLSRSHDELRGMNVRLRYDSSHDALTGLPNRAAFDAEFRRLSEAGPFPVAVVMADLDGLKEINDTRGHDEGDILIRKAAAVLSRAVRGSDFVARIGGDEFVALLPSADEGASGGALARIRDGVAHANAGGPPVVSLSVGVASASDGASMVAALKEADARMYAEKAERKRRLPSPPA